MLLTLTLLLVNSIYYVRIVHTTDYYQIFFYYLICIFYIYLRQTLKNNPNTSRVLLRKTK